MQQTCAVLSSAGRVAMGGIDLALGSRLTWLITAASLAYFTGGVELQVAADKKAAWHKRFPHTLTWATAIACAGAVALMGTGLGRYPLTGRLIAYSATQALMIVTDGYLLGRVAAKPAAGSKYFLHSNYTCQIRPLALPLVAVWFGCRLLDGWYRASMPPNTLPFASLMAHTRLGATPLVVKITTWIGATTLFAKVVKWGSVVGPAVLKGTDPLISSRLTWLVSGVATTCLMGLYRASELQKRRQDPNRKYCGDPHPLPCCPNTWEMQVRKGAFSEPCDACEEGHAKPVYHKVQCQVRSWQPASVLPLAQRLVSGKTSALLLGAYSVVLLLGVTAGGRVSLSGRSMGYLVGQVGMKWLDGVLCETCFIGRLSCDDDGVPSQDLTGIYFPPRAWVAAGLGYFCLRLIDGGLMASMPPNTPPWLSLGMRLASLVR
jgi:hypothetical protein